LGLKISHPFTISTISSIDNIFKIKTTALPIYLFFLSFTRKVKPFVIHKNLNNFPLFKKTKKILTVKSGLKYRIEINF